MNTAQLPWRIYSDKGSVEILVARTRHADVATYACLNVYNPVVKYGRRTVWHWRDDDASGSPDPTATQAGIMIERAAVDLPPRP